MSRPLHFLSLPHPAAILRGAVGHEPLAKRSLHHLATYLKDPTAWPVLDVTEPPTEAVCHLDPTFDEVISFLDDLPPEGVALDLEGNAPHIRCVGLCRLDNLTYLCVWLLKQGGTPAWSDDRRDAILAALRLKLPEVPLWMHNGQAFDYGELCDEPLRLDPTRVADAYLRGGDTMLAQRHAYGEQPAGLQHMAISYLRYTAWKHTTNLDDEVEGKA